MALHLVVDSLDSVPEPIRDQYEERDGKYHLNVEGVEDTAGLKSALHKERQLRAQHEKQVKAWEKVGKTPDEIAEMLAEQARVAEEKARKDGDHASILKQKQDAWEKEKADLIAERDASRASERSAIVGERLQGALAKAGATAEGIELLPDRLASRIKFETVDGKRVLKITQADGDTPMAGSGADGTATLDDLVKEVSGKYPSLFKGNGGAGGGKQPGDNTSGGSAVKRKSDFKSERERAKWVDANGIEAYQALPDR